MEAICGSERQETNVKASRKGIEKKQGKRDSENIEEKKPVT